MRRHGARFVEALNALDPAARLDALRESIARRARDCGRAPEAVKLVAVSKTFSADEVWPTIAVAGQTRFGENRVQEAIPKWRDCAPAPPRSAGRSSFI